MRVKKYYIILLLAVLFIVIMFLYGRIPQDPDYHHFADQRRILGIPYFMDVITNLPFVLIGVLELHFGRGCMVKGKSRFGLQSLSAFFC